MRVRPVEARAASAAELSAVHGIWTAVLRHDEPDRRRPTLTELRAELAVPWPGLRTAYWLCDDVDDMPAGTASLALPSGPNNHQAYAQISVHPDRRRRGAGRHLLGEVVRMAYASGREHVSGRVLDSLGLARVARSVQAQAVHREVRSVLNVAGVDINALPGAPDGYYFLRVRGHTPQELYADIAAAHSGMADAPRGESAADLEPHDVERIIAFDRMLAGRGLLQLRILAIHRTSGEPAGISYAILPMRKPARSEQGDTVVAAAHRGHGLGQAVKAELLRWLRADFPQVTDLTTWVAADNTPMHTVNHALGYRDVATYTHWELPVGALISSLGMR